MTSPDAGRGLPAADYRRLFEALPGCYLVLAPDLKIVAASDAYLRATMTERSTITGRDVFEVFPDNPDDQAAAGERNLRASFDRVRATRAPDRMAIQKYDVRRPAAEGGEFEVRYWSPLNSPVFDDAGQLVFLLHQVEDVTDVVRLRDQGTVQGEAIRELTERSRERQEELLDAREASARLRVFIDHAPISVAMLDRDMRYIHTSARWRKDYRLGERDCAGVSHYEVFPEIGEEWRKVHQRALDGEVIRTEGKGERFVRSDGTEQWLRWEVRPWRDAAGQIGGIVIFTEDVTEGTRAGREADRMTQWFKLALAAANAGAWQWTIATNDNVWSDQLWKLYGLDPALVRPSFEAWRDAVIDEDRDAAVRSVEDAARSGADLSLEFRVRWPDGSVHHLFSRGQAVRSGGPTPERYVGIVIDVTERKQLEAVLVQREREEARRESDARAAERYRELLDAAPDAMLVVGEDGRIDLVNVQTERVFGYSRDELVGQPLEVLLPERARAPHALHVADFFAAPSVRPMGTGIELSGRLKSGREIPIEVSLSPVRIEGGLAVSAAVRDISERKRLIAEATLMAQRLTSAVESAEDAFALFDEKDDLILCNALYRRLLGAPTEATLIGRPYGVLLDQFIETLAFSDDAARELFRRERLAERHRAEPTTYTVRTKDGRSLRVTNRRTDEGGIVKTIWDLTADERRTEELRHAHSVAAAASAAKSEFLSSMSHELRTPLNAILGFAQLLERDKRDTLSERQRERVHRVLSGGEQLLRLIDDVLDLSRIESGQIAISIEAVRVEDVLAEVKRALEPMEARYGITVKLDPLPAGLPAVSVDRMRYAQILTNFCSNALKYNRPGGTVRVTVAMPSPSEVRATVRDTGVGIPLAKQPLLFQPFQRAGQETGPIEGTGIGLLITRRLATMMNGHVGFDSQEDVGSAFWVDVPVHVGAAVARRTRARTSDAIQPSEGGRRRLLLYVEDNPANVAFMRDLAESLGEVSFLTAPTAELGVELAREHRPDIIIMDINLAGSMTGIDACKALRASSLKDIPIIALTAAASARELARGQEAGFDRYLTKPVNVDQLVSALETLLGHRQEVEQAVASGPS